MIPATVFHSIVPCHARFKVPHSIEQFVAVYPERSRRIAILSFVVLLLRIRNTIIK